MTHDNNCIQAMDVVEAFGAHWPMSGRDLDDLPAFAKEMVEGIQEHAREWARADALKEVAAEVEKMKQEKPKRECLNAETKLFGRCFDCEKVKGYNRALDDVLEALTKKI